MRAEARPARRRAPARNTPFEGHRHRLRYPFCSRKPWQTQLLAIWRSWTSQERHNLRRLQRQFLLPKQRSSRREC